MWGEVLNPCQGRRRLPMAGMDTEAEESQGMIDGFYRLRGKAFQPAVDADFFYESRAQRRALSYLGHALDQGECSVVVTGAAGVGKSMLAAFLLHSQDPDSERIVQLDNSLASSGEIGCALAQSLGLNWAGGDKETLRSAIERFAHDQTLQGRRCLLIVDDAHRIPARDLEELQALCAGCDDERPVLQTLLLRQTEPGQRMTEAMNLEALGENEVQPYIESRLKCVGWEGNPAFDQRVFTEIHRSTAGVPSEVNRIADRLLLLGAVDQRTRVDCLLLKQVLAELGAGVGQIVEQVEEIRPDREADASRRTDMADFSSLLAERDAQIAELRSIVSGLADARSDQPAKSHDGSAQLTELMARLDELEGRMIEQDRMIRHTLTMLIEWIEDDDAADREAA